VIWHFNCLIRHSYDVNFGSVANAVKEVGRNHILRANSHKQFPTRSLKMYSSNPSLILITESRRRRRFTRLSTLNV